MLTRGDTTKDKLIRAAITVAARDGLAAATTAALAAEAGVAEGTLYRHYTGKDELLIDAYRAVKKGVYDAASRQLVDQPTARDRVVAAWRAIYDAYRSDPDASAFGARFAESALAAREGGVGAAALMDLIRRLLADAAAQEQVKDLDPELMRALFYAPMTALLKAETAGRPWTDAELDAAAQAVWDSWRA